MTPICTLYSEFTDAKNFQGCGYKLDKLEKKNVKILHLQKKLNQYINDKNQNDLIKKQFKKEIKGLKSKNTNLTEEELSLTQKYSSKKDSEIMSLKAKLVNIKVKLNSKISELKHLKSEDISVSVVGGDSEKNISNETSKNFSKYFVCRKIMNEVKKISTDILTHTNDKIVPILESSKIDTEVTFKIKNITPIRSHNITIERSEELLIIALGASIVNKYQTTPI
ncbi:22582_t:CDS:2, partial [Cetraspora pellucida]